MRVFTGLLLFLAIASSAGADIIYLKSGRKIECDSAWEEGKQVKYVIAEGTVGIPRAMVARIEKAAPSPPPAPQSAPAQAAEATQTALASPQTAPAGTQTQTAPAVHGPVPVAKIAQSYTTLGKALILKKDYVGALEYLKRAYETVKAPETVYNLAYAYYMLKDDWNASLLFNELLRLEPRNTEALNYLAEMAWRKEDLEEAKKYWERSYAIQPSPEIKQKLSRLEKEKKASDAYDDSATRHFLVKYDGGTADSGLVDEIVNFMELKYQELSMQFEEYPSAPFVVVLYPQKDYITITDAPFWSAGVNDGKIKMPIRGLRNLTPETEEVLAHELVHSFVDLKTEGNCPVWLQEGLAQYLEGVRAGLDATDGLRKMAEAKALPQMSRLAGSFTGANSEQAAVLYLLSLSYTEFLIERYHFYEMVALLEHLGKGQRFDRAFENTYFIPTEEAEEAWRRSLLE